MYQNQQIDFIPVQMFASWFSKPAGSHSVNYHDFILNSFDPIARDQFSRRLLQNTFDEFKSSVSQPILTRQDMTIDEQDHRSKQWSKISMFLSKQ